MSPTLKIFLAGVIMFSCADKPGKSQPDYQSARSAMVEKQLKARDISDPKVLQSMEKVPRHLFVPQQYRSQAYGDFPLPIGFDQTISQPYIVAIMTQLLQLKGGETVLEIGTGSGYQAAVLAEICARVCSIEIIPQLAQSAEKTLKSLEYDNIEIVCADGYKGWTRENILFDGIIITAAPPEVPETLLNQLKIGGRLVLPEGNTWQELRVYTRTTEGFSRKNIIPVRFVPMIHGEN